MPNETTSHYSRFEANKVNVFSATCTEEAHLKLTPLSIRVKRLQINNMLFHIYGKFLDLCWNEQTSCVIHKEPCLEHTVHEGHPVVTPADLSCQSC
jgi:hypothetical protein